MEVIRIINIFLNCFSYDLREKYIEKAAHWKGEHLNERAFFRTATEPASLNINHVEEKDEGEYKCRVDFVKSPTRTSRIQLVVIGKSQLKPSFAL